jgi:hypothetical protein
MAVAGGATVAYAIKWNPELNQVVVLTKTTVQSSRCDSVVNACALLSKGQNALIAGSDIEMVRQRMADREKIKQQPQEG